VKKGDKKRGQRKGEKKKGLGDIAKMGTSLRGIIRRSDSGCGLRGR